MFQGSPYLFILCAEILGAAVRRDSLIRGIKISDNDCKLSEYADDTTLMKVKNDHRSKFSNLSNWKEEA